MAVWSSIVKLKSLKIFLGDLTYDTITLATESFPLNIGFVASYCLSKYPNNIDIKLFKYIDKIEKAIEENPPDVLGLSNYAWNRRIGLEILYGMSTDDHNIPLSESGA